MANIRNCILEFLIDKKKMQLIDDEVWKIFLAAKIYFSIDIIIRKLKLCFIHSTEEWFECNNL